MVFKVQQLEKTVLLVRGYRKEADIEYDCVCTLYKPEGQKKWQVLGFMSKKGSPKEAKVVLQYLKNFPDGTYTYVSDEDFNRFYKKHNFKQIEL